MKIQKRDVVRISDLQGGTAIGEVISISNYHEPDMKYAIEVAGFPDLIFCGDKNIIEVIN